MLKNTALPLCFLWLSAGAQAATPQGDCSGSPEQAIVDLPAPLSEWGTIVCTPYGHIISNKQGWIWSKPGGFSPVFIPAQMVRSNPQPMGNAAHFTKIEFSEVSIADKAASAALAAFQEGLDPEPPTKTYRLSATGSSGKNLVLYFFQTGTSIWAIWCDSDGANCKSDTRFMLLNMREGRIKGDGSH